MRKFSQVTVVHAYGRNRGKNMIMLCFLAHVKPSFSLQISTATTLYFYKTKASITTQLMDFSEILRAYIIFEFNCQRILKVDFQRVKVIQFLYNMLKCKILGGEHKFLRQLYCVFSVFCLYISFNASFFVIVVSKARHHIEGKFYLYFQISLSMQGQNM